jgi:hypothetical protein
MNIFYIDSDVRKCAEMHNSKHVIKMILEENQLLSTAHRVLDGIESTVISDSGRKKKVWELPDERNHILYSATHINHPSAIWVRQSNKNYQWLWEHVTELCKEYTFRYGKIHKCESSGLVLALNECPKNIPIGEFTEPTPAMPVEYIVQGDSLTSYRNYYVRGKQHLASWEGKVNSREVPLWYRQGCLDLMAEDAQKLGLGY